MYVWKTMTPTVLARMLAALPADGAGPIGQLWLQIHRGSAYHIWRTVPSEDRFHAVMSYQSRPISTAPQA